MFEIGDKVKVVRHIDGIELLGKEGEIITRQLTTVTGRILYLVVIEGQKYGLCDDEIEEVENE